MIEVTVLENKLKQHPTPESILEQFEELCERARRNFIRDGELFQTFILTCLDGPNHCPCELVIPAPFRDREEKNEYYDFVHKMAGDTMAVAVTTISECWYSSVPFTEGLSVKEMVKKHLYKQAGDDPQRREIIQVAMASSLTTPRNRTRYAYIHRGGRKPRIGPWEDNAPMLSSKGALFDLLPVRGD